MEKNQQIEALIIKSFNNRTSNEELNELHSWINYSEKNKNKYESYFQLWNDSKHLVLSDSIDIESALLQTKQQIPIFKKRKRWLKVIQQVAAVVLLAVAFSVFYQQFKERSSIAPIEQTVYQEVNASCGTQTRLTLSDGSVVWLNSGSTLCFPLSFRNQNNRKVELQGEGYFDVKKNEKQPFIVHTSAIDVKVLGTSFNVSAYKNEHEITVALVEGKVALVKEINGVIKKILELNPMESAIFNPKKNNIVHSKVDLIDKYTAWKDGRIVFYNDPIEKVVSRLENWYNVEIEVDDSTLSKYHFTATFIDESLEQVFKLLSLSSPMEYEIIPAKKNSNNSYGKRKILLTHK